MRTLPLIVSFILASAIAAGQVEPCTKALAAGENALDAKQKETAAIHLREARRAALRMSAGPERDKLLQKIGRLLRKADPKDTAHLRVVNGSVEQLLALARHYLKKGWCRTAAELIRMAEALDVDACAKARQELLVAMRAERMKNPRALTLAIEAGLDWLARHQDPQSGGWDGDGFFQLCQGPACDGKAYPRYDEGLTGLAVLAFLDAGHTPQDGTHGDALSHGIRFLVQRQARDGSFGDKLGHYMYNQCVAALALVEAFGRSREETVREPAAKAVAFLLLAQNQSGDGTTRQAWRYSARCGDNDTSVSGWAVKAVMRGRALGLEVPEAAVRGARDWMESMLDPETGRIGYTQRGISPVRAPGREENWSRALSEAITALGMESRLLLGLAPTDPSIEKGVRLLEERLPRWEVGTGAIDHYYWYAATHVLSRLGGPVWDKWRKALFDTLLANQRMVGCAAGSFDPVGPWGQDGGRVYSTAVLVSCLAKLRAAEAK